MPIKTEKQIQAEIEALREMKPWIPHHTMFGDDNYAKIEAQIQALKDMDEEEQADDEWPEESDHEVRSAACDAIRWKNGDEDGSPSENWSSIDSRKKATKTEKVKKAKKAKKGKKS